MCNLKSKAKCKLPKIKITRHTFHNKNQRKTSGIKKPQPVQIHGVSVCRKQKDPGAQHSAPADCCHQMNSVEYNSL